MKLTFHYTVYCSVTSCVVETSSVFGHCLRGNNTELSLNIRLFLSKDYCSSCGSPHLTDPGDERGHTGKDRWPLSGVTASSIHKTSHSLYVPPTISALAVQRASRVALEDNGRH